MSIIPIFQLLISLMPYGQNATDNTETFRITKSYMNGENISKFDIERGGVLIFDVANARINNLKNYSEVDKTESFGIVDDYISDTVNIEGASYRKMNTSFKWHFQNDYDSLYGIALIEFNQKETAYGTDFKLKMSVVSTGELIEYSGYKEGTRSSFILNETIHK